MIGPEEGRAYANLGNAYLYNSKSLGRNFRRKAIDCLSLGEKHLKIIAIEIGDRAGEGRAYGNLGNAYRSLGDFRKAIEYHEKRLKIAKEIGDRAGEGAKPMEISVMLTGHWVTSEKPLSIMKNTCSTEIAIEIGDRA